MLLLALLIGAAGCAAALLAFAKAARLRTAIYRYDVRTDQRYDFSRCGATAISGQLLRGVLDLGARPHGCGVMLLEVRIQSTLLGRWFEPCIEIASTRARSRQAVERGGCGLRYVELSQHLESDTSLRLIGHHLEISDQPVVLHCLGPPVDLDRQKILVLATHPDDAEIAAFGVYADRDAHVVTLTAGEAGEPGPFARFGDAAHYEKGRTRAWNSVTVPMLGGLSITRSANLGYFDDTLPTMKECPDTPMHSRHAPAEFLDVFGQAQDGSLLESRQHRRATWTNLVADLERLLQRLQPDLVVTPYPRLDEHPDHKASTVALLQAMTNLNWRRGSLLLYVNHLYSSDRYPFGAAGDWVGLPPGIGDVFFDGILSHPLDVRMQARKHIALDAMIDLRAPPHGAASLGGSSHGASWRSVAALGKRVLKAKLTDGEASYFRQAVRANELFFVVRVSSLFESGVIERLLHEPNR